MVRFILTALIWGLFCTSAHAYPAYGKHLPHRSLIYFSPSEDGMVKDFLKGVMINNCQLEERDIMIMVIAEDGFTLPGWLVEELNIKDVSTVYNIPKGSHTAILIGKDGEEKLRWDGETDWNGITKLIDEMPMRKQEMQRQQSRCNI
ncbi:DUF4174 domain-containing protein [Vibrio makurazakiensis]|uniref:DUF4174 domain-containing protein n=1 Tax=Vibrio makurazakiensis TaxID=2910250 RepID=UPI003D0F0D9A